MARSHTPEATIVNSDVEVDESVIEVETSSANEVSDNPPDAASSVERSFPPAQPLRKFWIELPPLPKDYDEYKYLKVPRLQKSKEASSSEQDEETSRVPVKLVGEVVQNRSKYYYAEVEGGVITKFTADSVQDKYPNLVRTYERKLKNGTLPAFDPSGTNVHPKHRIKIHVKPPQRSTTTSTRSSTRSSTPKGRSEGSEVVSVSSDSSDSSNDNSSDSDSGDVPARHSTRLAGLPQKKRFSPRKARNLRSGGKPGASSASSATEVDSDSGSAYEVRSSDSEERHIKPIRLKRPARKRETIKGLGIVRSIDDPADSDSDAEGAVLLRHRERCERCGELPAHKLLEAFNRRKAKKKGPSRRKKNADDDEESEPEEERIERLGGWIRCLHCCVSGHWGCLSGTQRQEIQLAAKAHENELMKAERRAEGQEVADDAVLVEKRKEIWLDETTEFVCTLCARGAPCIVCKEDTTPDAQRQSVDLNGGTSAGDAIDLATPPPEGTVNIQPATPSPNKNNAAPSSPKSSAKPLSTVKPGELHSRYAPINVPQVLFRCKNCRRPAHWQHLPAREPGSEFQRTALQVAAVYQERGPDQWKCHDCVRWKYAAESILAWRPDPPGAVETFARGEVPKTKDPLRREYLVKFKERGFRRIEWVPHMWLLSMHEGLLRHFLKSGTKLPLLEDESEEFQEKTGAIQKVDTGKGKAVEKNGALDVLPVFARSRSASEGGDVDQPEYDGIPGPMLDAPKRIPDSWLRIDRLLDAVLAMPQAGKKITQFMKKKSRGKGETKRIDSEEDELGSDSEEDKGRAQFTDGEPPDPDVTETVRDFELRMGRKIKVKEIMERAVWVYTKFEGLQYEDCTWDTPPRPGSLEWDSYKRAVSRYVFAQSVEVPKLTKEEERKRDNRPWREISYWTGQDLQPKLEDKSLSLMPFQVQGLQWLYGNWHNLQPSILADDMGLGKTVQLVSLIGKLVSEHVFPHLIVVPNSTIVNWVREFERWTPHVRVVRFNGEAKGREVIKKTELYNSDGKQMYHALVTTYETLAGVEFHQVFKKPGRWETVVVDEGQRLKSDSSLLFRKLTELKTIHRILMTGTPLNNNIRELFNLMNFLDPKEWNNLDELEKEYDQENLTEELIGKLHERLRPYFLRRQKAEVLDLPDKHEVIVPVSLVPIQKDIMRAILEANLSMLGLLVDKNLRENRKGQGPKKSSLHNALMEMRKCIQHPYLNQADMERRGLSQGETLKQLVDASAKFRLLKMLLPQLKKRGHRVLLFSQFKIVLDIIEDFLVMEGYKLLRLDGDTKSSLRQKEIDDFNKPGSDYFIYILTTRAGGVGVNLWSADTVIVFDPDFNPHQDLQAIARAHRYGQTKRVLVFKFMAKNTPEEKIFMMGKKKLVLDHLIVQKLGDEDEMDDVQGILTHGAKALFENPGESAEDIKYTEHDIEELITRAETEKSEEKKSEAGMKFDFAQVWDRGQGTKIDIQDETQDTTADEDFWAGVIRRAAEEKAKKRAQELTGRGARKRAIANYNELDLFEGSPEKKPKPKVSKSGSSSDQNDYEFKPPGNEPTSSSDDDDDVGSEDGVLASLPDPLSGEPGAHLPGPSKPRAIQGMSAADANFVPSLPTTTFVHVGPPAPPKVKKPKKPKASNPVPPPPVAIPSTSVTTETFEIQNAARMLGEYRCPACGHRHRMGECTKDGSIDKILQTWNDILSPDNEDTDANKYFVFNHIIKKLRGVGFDMEQLKKPAPPPVVSVPKTSTKPRPRPPKPKDSLALGSSNATPTNYAQVPGAIGSAASLGPALANPKPRKKPKPLASVSGPSGSVTAPYQPLAAPGPAPFAFHRPYPAPGPSPPVANPPFAKQPVPLVNTMAAATSTSDAATTRRDISASTLTAMRDAARLHTALYPQPMAPMLGMSGMPGMQIPAVPHIVTPAASSSPAPVPNLAFPSTSTPRAPTATFPAATTPAATTSAATTSAAATSAAATSAAATSAAATPTATNKRPATDQPEEERKKKTKFSACLICNQKPGHLVIDCPDVQTVERLRNTIQRLETTGPGHEAMLKSLRRILTKREQKQNEQTA